MAPSFTKAVRASATKPLENQAATVKQKMHVSIIGATVRRTLATEQPCNAYIHRWLTIGACQRHVKAGAASQETIGLEAKSHR